MYSAKRECTATILGVKELASKQLLVACFLLVTYLAYSLTLKTEAIHSSETSVHFYRTTQHLIPEDSTFHHSLSIFYILHQMFFIFSLLVATAWLMNFGI
jgi:hypothetical protein